MSHARTWFTAYAAAKEMGYTQTRPFYHLRDRGYIKPRKVTAAGRELYHIDDMIALGKGEAGGSPHGYGSEQWRKFAKSRSYVRAKTSGPRNVPTRNTKKLLAANSELYVRTVIDHDDAPIVVEGSVEAPNHAAPPWRLTITVDGMIDTSAEFDDIRALCVAMRDAGQLNHWRGA